MRFIGFIFALLALFSTPAFAQDNSTRAQKILFIGNSFTYGATNATIHYRSSEVTDLNGENIGGVPALFDSFADQSGLSFRVYLETRPGSGLDWHYQNRLNRLDKRWDHVVMHTYSTLDAQRPGNPEKLLTFSGLLADKFAARNRNVRTWLMSTWSRADLIYRSNSPWRDTPIDKMALDLRAGYDLAAANRPSIAGVIPVGEAWNMAFARGIADPNPYDGIDYGKVDLWGWDSYHASTYGAYLTALVVFAKVTGRDPRLLGEKEKSANDLGISPKQAAALQGIAFEIAQK